MNYVDNLMQRICYLIGRSMIVHSDYVCVCFLWMMVGLGTTSVQNSNGCLKYHVCMNHLWLDRIPHQYTNSLYVNSTREPNLHVGSMSKLVLLFHNVIMACWSMRWSNICIFVITWSIFLALVQNGIVIWSLFHVVTIYICVLVSIIVL